jgi:hypothetical protein
MMWDQEKPPKSGKVKKLWDWFIKETNGQCAIEIESSRLTREQESSGIAPYAVEVHKSLKYDMATARTYAVWDIDETIKHKLIEAEYRTHGDLTRHCW